MTIKLLLVLGVLSAAVPLLLGQGARRLAIRRILLMVFMVFAAASVFRPDLWTRVANLVGVGRGTDLVLYALVVAFFGFVMRSYVRNGRWSSAHPAGPADRPGRGGTDRTRPPRRGCRVSPMDIAAAGGSLWCVTGGAGYIGGHVVRALRDSGRDVVVLDDLSSGDPARLPSGVRLVVGEVGDPRAVREALSGRTVHGVLHLAARKAVGESVDRPLWYWRQNVQGLQTLLDEAVDVGVRRFVYSSSAAVYGQPDTLEPIREDAPCEPINPYGATKRAGEWMIDATARRFGWRAVSLRYFNVAGAGDPALGDRGVANLIPLVFRALDEERPPQVFGDDYPTADGTCVRDYVHVADLARAHVAAVGWTERSAAGTPLPDADQPHLAVNVGTGQGASVLEVLDAVGKVVGHDVGGVRVARRAGDPAQLVAAVDRAREVLGWAAEHDLHDMVSSAWESWLTGRG
jgi:UDP-glucose 4-epimerase